MKTKVVFKDNSRSPLRVSYDERYEVGLWTNFFIDETREVIGFGGKKKLVTRSIMILKVRTSEILYLENINK